MDNNQLLGLTTLAQQQSKTPLVTGGKAQQFIIGVNNNMNSDQLFDNNMSHSRLDGLSTVDYNNSKRSPFRSTYRNGIDESSDNISRAQSNYDNITTFGSPGLNKSMDKTTGKAKLQQQLGAGHNQQNPNMYPTFGSQTSLGGQQQPGQNAQRQSHTHLNYQSPDKSNVRSARKGSNAKSARSNSSIESSERHGSARRGSVNRGLQNSASRRRSSYSGTDQDSQERSFTYPCQAFKQFLLAVREGKIDMKDLNNSPFLIDYLTMQAQIGGGGSGGAGDKGFANSLRSSTASNRSGSKNNRDHSNKKNRRQSNLGESIRAPKDSIIEEEEDDNAVPSNQSRNPKHNFNSNSKNQNSANKGGNNGAHGNNNGGNNGVGNSGNKISNYNVNKRVPSPQKTQSPLKQQRQQPTSSGNPASSAVAGNTNGQGGNLAKHNFKEDRNQNNVSPLKGGQSQQSVQNNSRQPLNKQSQQSPDKQKQRRGRGDRSTSGDEGAGNRGGNYATGQDNNGGDNGVVDLRFDEKGRPIKNSNQQYKSNQKPVGGFIGKQNLNENSEDDQVTQGGGDYNSNNTLNNSVNDGGKSGNKNRRGRRDRDSSVSSSVDQYDNGDNMIKSSSGNINPYTKTSNNKLTSSPNEPRSISKLPKPTERDDKPVIRQSQQNPTSTMLPIIDERVNTNGDNQEDGTFRDYQNSNRTGNETDRLVIFDKNTDFKTDQDYELNALKDNQTKKYLKSKVSPLKKQQFREDEEQDVSIGAGGANDGDDNVINLADDDNDTQSNILNTNDNNNDDSQSEVGGQYANRQNSYQDPIVGNSITMMKKTPGRESRKAHSQFYGAPNSGNNQQQTPHDSSIRGGDTTNGAGYDNQFGGDDLDGNNNGGNNTNKYNEYLDSNINQGSPIKGSRTNNNLNSSKSNRNDTLKNQDSSDFYNTNNLNDNYSSLNPTSTLDKPMQRNDLDDTDLNDRDSQLAMTRNQSSGDKKKRRGRANRHGGSSETSQERMQPLEARNFDSNSRNQQYDSNIDNNDNNDNSEQQHQDNTTNNNKSPSQYQKSPQQYQKSSNRSPQKSHSNYSPVKSNRNNQQHQDDNMDNEDGCQLTIEEHLDTFRSKNSSQVNYLKSHRSNNTNNNYQNDDQSGDDQDYDNNYDNQDVQDKSNRNKSNTQSPSKSVKSRNNGDRSNKNYRDTNNNRDNTTRSNNNQNTSIYNNNDDTLQMTDRSGRSNKQNLSNNSPSKKRNHQNDGGQDNDYGQDIDQYDQDRSQSNLNSGRQESSRYQHDDYLNSNRKENSGNERKRENRRSNANNTQSSHYPQSYNNDNSNRNQDNTGGKSNKSRNNQINQANTQDQMRQSQRSLTNLANTNYDEYNYSSFGQQNPNDNYDSNNDYQQNNNGSQNVNSTGKKQRRKRGSRERSNDSNHGGQSNDEAQQRSSQIKNSIQPLRTSYTKAASNRKERQYATNNNYPTNYSSNYDDRNTQNNNQGNNTTSNNQNNHSNVNNQHEDEQKLLQNLQQYQSRLKELEDKLKQQIQENPNKPLDYRLIQDINDEAARTIQMQFRLRKLQKKQKEDAGHQHGNLTTRMVQTDPVHCCSSGVKPQTLGRLPNGQFDMDKFKRFFFAVFYTYMMMNTIMADVFKRQQPVQVSNQWNEQDYKDYLNRRGMNKDDKKE